jgi:hypothetical protein
MNSIQNPAPGHPSFNELISETRHLGHAATRNVEEFSRISFINGNNHEIPAAGFMRDALH